MKNQSIRLICLFLLTGILLTLSSGCKKKTDPEPEPVATVTDIDGNIYHKITVGTQVWLVENLKTTRYRNGDQIPNVTVDSLWNKSSNNSTGAFCNYNNDVYTGNTYGLLYNWFAASDSRGLAPEGWRVASQADWQTLVSYLGGDTVAGGKLKETGTTHWFAPNAGATNVVGFTALPGGLRVYSGKYEMIGTFGIFWTTTVSDEFSAFNCGLFNETPGAVIDGKRKGYGFSVRCIKN
jgi:uncharacterized protein (TIGR02145 family)